MAAIDPLDDAPAEKLVHALGNRAADYASRGIGSWRFVIAQSLVLAAYIWWMIHAAHPLDPYPFVFCNLLLSFQAAYTGPVLLIAANHQAGHDRTAINLLRADVAEIKAMLRNGGGQ